MHNRGFQVPSIPLLLKGRGCAIAYLSVTGEESHQNRSSQLEEAVLVCLFEVASLSLQRSPN